MNVHVARETVFDKWLPEELALMRIGFCARHCVRHITHINYLILSSQEFLQNKYYFLHLTQEKNETSGD